MVRDTIFKRLGKVTLNLNYDNSSPSSALVCPCARGDSHAATANTQLGYWTCARNAAVCGELTPLQLLWLQKVMTDHSEAATITFGCDRNTLLTEHDLPNLLRKLNKHATKWRDIGTQDSTQGSLITFRLDLFLCKLPL